MLKRIKALFLVAIIATSALSPLSAIAAGSVDFDADRDLLLELLDIQVTNQDLLYTDAEFVELVNSFGDLNRNIDQTAEDFIAILDSAIEFAEQMQDIEDPRFDEYKMSAEELAEMKALVDELKTEMQENGNTFSDILYSEFLDTGNYDSPIYEEDYNQYLNAYGYADKLYAVPGQEVTLLDYSTKTDQETLSSTIWNQSVGPKVELYTIEGAYPTDKNFIMPEFTNAEVNYVAFDLMVSQNGETSTYPVYIYLDQTGEMAIRQLYNQILWREADDAGLNFWMQEYQNGVSLKEIEAAFMNSDEYLKRA